MRIEDPYANSSKRFRVWHDALKSGIGNILQGKIGEDKEKFIQWAQRVEWDNIIAGNLESSRKKDQYYDPKMAWLVYYDDEIDEEERRRRWDSLDVDITEWVIEDGE